MEGCELARGQGWTVHVEDGGLACDGITKLEQILGGLVEECFVFGTGLNCALGLTTDEIDTKDAHVEVGEGEEASVGPIERSRKFIGVKLTLSGLWEECAQARSEGLREDLASEMEKAGRGAGGFLGVAELEAELVEEALGRPFGSDADRADESDVGGCIEGCCELAEGRVEADVEFADGVFEGTGLIAVAPELMDRSVGFAEDDEGEARLAGLDEAEEVFDFEIEAIEELAIGGEVLVEGGMRIFVNDDALAEGLNDFGWDGVWRRLGVVDRPFRNLNALETCNRTSIGDIEDEDWDLAIGEGMPKGRGRDGAGIERLDPVCARSELAEPLVVVDVTGDAGSDRDPDAMFANHFRAFGEAPTALIEEAGDVGKQACRGPLANQVRTTGVDAEDEEGWVHWGCKI